jgi:hypothetical protein
LHIESVTGQRVQLGLIVRAGLVQNCAEKTAEVADGHGNPPEVTTDTPWLVNVADELVLLQLPEMVAAAVVVEFARQVWPTTLAVHETPFCGMVRFAAPLEDAHRFQVPLVVQLAPKLKNPALTVHPLRVGAVMLPQIGCPEAEVVAVPLVDDTVQLTVAVPSRKVALVPEHKAAVKGPPGETASAYAAWPPRPGATARTPRPNTAARPRVMRICVAFMAFMVVTPVRWDSRRRGGTDRENPRCLVPRSICRFERHGKTGIDKYQDCLSDSDARRGIICVLFLIGQQRREQHRRPSSGSSLALRVCR